MEIIVKQIKDISRQIVLNQTFSNFESYPNGAYYKNLKGEIKQEDLAANYW
ncbi:hypothetical protein [Paenibacillus periandrae]|uniref:hypothetical protein n=1 Tax=Paenibacillus periandrae TaxID=1761741 RepID=UPI001F095C1E|nr:hypothetical protein [Paenibacillus periandrae]